MNVLISNNISFKSKAEVEIINVSDSNFPDYDEYLFIIFPALSDKFYTYKNDLENKLAQLKERLLNNNFDVEERNKLMKSLNDTKDEIYQQNAFINEQIGTPIKFSQKLHFIHFKSEMYLCTQNQSINKNKICLVDQCNEDCIFLFWPYNKFDLITDDVFSNQNLLIRKCDKSIWTTNPYLSISEIKGNNDYFMMLNSRKANKKHDNKNFNDLSPNTMESSSAKLFNTGLFSHDLVKLESHVVNNTEQKEQKFTSKYFKKSNNEEVPSNPINKEEKPNENSIQVFVTLTDDISQAKPFVLKINSNYIDSSTQNLSFKNTISLKFSNSDSCLLNINSSAHSMEFGVSLANNLIKTENLIKRTIDIKKKELTQRGKKSKMKSEKNLIKFDDSNDEDKNNSPRDSSIKSKNELIFEIEKKETSEENPDLTIFDIKNKSNNSFILKKLDVRKKSFSSVNTNSKKEAILLSPLKEDKKAGSNNNSISKPPSMLKQNNNKIHKNFVFSNFKDEEINNNIMVFTKLSHNKTLGSINLLSLFKPEPYELDKCFKGKLKAKISQYIQYNSIIRLKHVITGNYLTFREEKYSDLTSTKKIVGVGINKAYGILSLVPEPDEYCNWTFIESYIILDINKYEKSKIKGLDMDKLNNEEPKVKIVKKQDILRLFHCKTKKFVSDEDVTDLHAYTNQQKLNEQANMKKNNNNSNKKTIDLLNNLKTNLHENINKFCLTLNLCPLDNDLIKINCISENLSWEVNLVIYFSENYITLIHDCVNSDIKTFIKSITDYQNQYEKNENNKDNINHDGIKIKITNPKELKSSSYIEEEIKSINKIKKKWVSLKNCFQELKDYCLNQFSKRYESTVQLGKPVTYRQEMLKEQGFLEITFNFLDVIKKLKDYHIEFIEVFDCFKKIHNPINRKNQNYHDNQNPNKNNYNFANNKYTNEINNYDKDYKTFKEMFEALHLLFTEVNLCISRGFEFIECMCKSNPDSINFVFKNRHIYSEYLLKYKEAAKCLIDIIKDDENFMSEIIHENINVQFNYHNNNKFKSNDIKSKYETQSIAENSNIKLKKNNKEDVKAINLIDSIIYYLMENSNKYDRYTLNLLSKLMKGNNKGITSNQEYIFRLLIIDEKNKFLLKIQPKFNDTMFYVIYNNENGQSVCKSLIELSTNSNKLSEHEKLVMGFLAEQLNLSADMCYGRNYICIDKMRELYPLDHLIHHIANLDINQEVLGALINILNYCYIDTQPHFRKIYPEMIKVINSDMEIVKDSFQINKSLIPYDRMNLILCISLFILYNIHFGKIVVNQNNIDLLYNLLSFKLYEDFDFDPSLYEEVFTQGQLKNTKSRMNLKEEVKRIIQSSDPVTKRILQRNGSFKNSCENNTSKDKDEDDDNNNQKNNKTESKIPKNNLQEESKISGDEMSDLINNICSPDITFYEFIGHKFLENNNDGMKNLGEEFICCIIRIINEFLFEKLVLENLDSNLQHMHILAQTFKPFSKQDILSMSNINFLLKIISETKKIFNSVSKNEEENKIYSFIPDEKNTKEANIKNNVFQVDLYLPIIKQFSKII